MGAKTKIIVAMATFGTIGLFVRGIALPSSEIALFRALIAIVSIGAYRLVFGGGLRLSVPRRTLLPLFLSGAAMGFNWILLFEAYRYTTISVATLSYYFAPVLVTLMSPLLFHERLTWVEAACFALSTAGLVLVINPGGGGDIRGVLFGLGAAALYATVVLFNKSIRDVAGIDRTLLQFVAAALVLAPYVALTGGFHIGTLDLGGALRLLTVGVVHTGVMYCLYFSSLRELSGQEASILSYMDPLVAVLLSVLALGEPATVMQIVGGAMILGFTLLNELLGHRQKKARCSKGRYS